MQKLRKVRYKERAFGTFSEHEKVENCTRSVITMCVQVISEIQGVQLFDTPSSCAFHFETTHLAKRGMSFIQSFRTPLSYALNKINLVSRQNPD
jgi:hypothetical protein